MEEFCITKANKCEAQDQYYFAKSWLLTGKSFASDGFQIQYELYLLEKRRKSLTEAARHFELLYRKFPSKLQKEVTEMINAVTTTGTENFLASVFNTFPKTLQMEVLINEAQKTSLDKTCQIMLLLVKLFPDAVHEHGADLLFSLLACPTDAPRPPGLVTELIPAVLQTKQNWAALTPQMFQILNQCIEHYVLASGHEDSTGVNDRWSKLFGLVDQIGVLMRWAITPFFAGYSGASSLESLYQKLAVAFGHRAHHKELSYITVVLFLHCIVIYHELRSGRGKSKLAEEYSSKLVLVEVFVPNQNRTTVSDPNLPGVLLTASHCSNVRVNQTHLVQYFVTATKIWQLINNMKGDRVEKDFFLLLHAMKSLKIENWNVFQDFLVDFEIYIGQQYSLDANVVRHPLKLASSYCAINNFKLAAENVIKAVNESVQDNKRFAPVTNPSNGEENKNGGEPVPFSNSSHREEVSFFNSHVYSLDAKGNFVNQRRVHFLSDHPAEIIAYAASVLIKCFYELVNMSQEEDVYLGHLLTLLQLEWPSPPAEQVFTQILDIIKRKGSFRYAPYFGDFVLEPDFLEQFMALANQQEGKNLILDIWPNNNGNSTGSSRRIATRGVDKGAKTVFLNSMKKQMFKNYEANLENLIVKFLTQHTADILMCFDQPTSYKKLK